MKVVNQPIMKKDAMALVTGKPVFTNDKAPKECLIVKLLRSPYANAMIKSINTQFAMKVLKGLRRFIHGKMCHRNVLRWQDRHIRN